MQAEPGLPTLARDTVDVVFPVLHGPMGEDGTIQGMLELAGIPYVGSGVLGSAVAMDKAMAKLVLSQAGIPQAKWALVNRHRVDVRSGQCRVIDRGRPGLSLLRQARQHGLERRCDQGARRQLSCDRR